ncbi:MAG TPA: hypothetical protein VFX78_00010 [Candidatus Eisenbacteria bacterium]|nr:hypothetical protein [Candidatus Eisenbacteria bacterium]
MTATERTFWTEQEAALIEAYRIALYAADDATASEGRANVDRADATNRYDRAVESNQQASRRRDVIEAAMNEHGISVDVVRRDLREQRDRSES